MSKQAIKLYKELDEEFCHGHPEEGINLICKTEDDLISYAMDKFAKQQTIYTLEKLKAEIIKTDCKYMSTEYLKGQNDVLDLINNHIKEGQ